MKTKTIIINDKFYTLTLLQNHEKINDEVLPSSRKVGEGTDKNHIFINNRDVLMRFFGHNFEHSEKYEIDVFFSLNDLVKNIGKVNKRLEIEFPEENRINIEEALHEFNQVAIDKSLQSGLIFDKCEL